MKQTLLLPVFLYLCFFLSAQTEIVVDPSSVNDSYSVDLSDQWAFVDAHSMIYNNSSNTVELKWTLEVIDAPPSWFVSVCDQNNCYEPVVFSNISPNQGLNLPITLAPGDSSILDLRLTPKGFPGSGNAKIHLANNLLPDSIISTVDFNYTVNDITSSVKKVSKKSIKVFPNPANEFIKLTQNDIVDQIVIYNLVGRQVKSFEVADGKKYRVSDLPDGLYLVSLINNQQGVIKTLRFSKRNLQP